MTRYLIEKGAERQNVTSLEGHEDWTVVSELPDVIPDDYAELVDGSWVVPIEVLRARKWEVIKAARDAAIVGGCDTPLGRMDTDLVSQGKVNGAATMAQIAGPAFTVDWTMQDNSVVTHDQEQMLAAALAVGQFVAACHARGQMLRAEIEAAETFDAINW